MRSTEVLRRLSAAVLLVSCLFAQEVTPGADAHARIVEGDAVAVERGRRELTGAGAGAVRAEVLLRVLRSRDDFRRSAAGSLLLRFGLVRDEVAAWLAEENDPRVLLPIVDLLPVDVLLRVVTAARRFVDSEDVEREDAERDLRDRAFGRLVELGKVDPELWTTVLGGEDAVLAEFAVHLAVAEVWPFPIARIGELGPRAKSMVLQEIGARPRSDLDDELAEMLGNAGLSTAERLLVLTAQRSENWSRGDIESLVDAALAEDPELRHTAELASWLVAPSVAVRMVGEVHRRLLAGAEIAGMLDLLRNVDQKGERMLVSLARQLDDAQRDAIVNWLGRRESPQLDVLLREALEGEYPLTPELLRRTGRLLDSDLRRARVLQFLRPSNQLEQALLGDTRVGVEAITAETRLSAFDALCEAGVWDGAMLEYALEVPEEQPGRLGVLLRLPRATIPDEAWRTMVARTDQRAAGRLITELMRDRLPAVVEDALVMRALSDAPASSIAAECCLRVGSDAAVEAVWNGLAGMSRRAQAGALRLRGDALARRLLLAEPRDGDRGELGLACLGVGDRAVLRELLRDPTSWDRVWLRRSGELVSKMLDQTELDRIVERFDALDESVKPIALDWIAARPDLDDHGLCARVLAASRQDLESELRPVALRRVLGTEDGRANLRAALGAKLAAGLDEVEQDEAYEVIGSAPAPIDLATASFLARFLLVEPLAHPEPDLLASMRSGPVPHEPRAQLAFLRMVRETTPATAAAITAALDAARQHASFALTSTARLERLLELFVREEVTRDEVCPLLAAAILEISDLDRRPLGPAYQFLAERAEREARFAEAASHWERAARWYLRAPIAPLAQRALLGDSSSFDRTSASAWLASRAPLCRARAALAVGAKADARIAIEAARLRAFGDLRALEEVNQLKQEIER